MDSPSKSGPGQGGAEDALGTRRRPLRSGRVVAVVGAASFLGTSLLRLYERDPRYAKLVAVDLRKPALDAPRKTQFHKIDLTLPTADAELAGLFAREHVDTVVHAAFLSTPTHHTAWAHELESIGTMHVLNAAGEARVGKLLMHSTTLVYGALPDNPNFLTEEHDRRGHRGARFVEEKRDAERQLHRFAVENPATCVTVLRAAATLGPTIRNWATRFFARPVCPVLLGYDPLVQLLHERDLVHAFRLATDEDFHGDFNLVGDGVLPYTTLLALLGRVPLPLPTGVAKALSTAMWATQLFDSPPEFIDFLRFLCVADGSKARRVMGFAPRYDVRATAAAFLGEEGGGRDIGVTTGGRTSSAEVRQ